MSLVGWILSMNNELHNNVCIIYFHENYYILYLTHLLFFLFSDVSTFLGQTIDTRIKLADALARQWFGAYITPEAPSDGKLVWSLFVLLSGDLEYWFWFIPFSCSKDYIYFKMVVWFLSSEWLLDGLAGFMTDLFIKKYLGNNEARYRRYKVCLLIGDFT